MSYCPKCGGTGILIDGSKCDCSLNIQDVYTDVACLAIPEQYRNVLFNKELVPNLANGAYSNFLDNLHTSLSTLQNNTLNYVICSPPRHSKTIFAYATMRRLFKGGLDVYPLMDLYEIKDELTKALGDSPLNKVPVLFVKFPQLVSTEIFQTASLLLDRRVRRGCTTIFLSNLPWSYLVKADTFSNFTAYSGDGYYCSVKVTSWREVNEGES